MPPDAAARAVPFRGGGFRPRRIGFIGPIVFVVLILLWQVGSQTGVISDVALPSPVAVFGAFHDLVVTGMLWKHLGASLYRLVVGWTLGTMFGVAIGLSI